MRPSMLRREWHRRHIPAHSRCRRRTDLADDGENDVLRDAVGQFAIDDRAHVLGFSGSGLGRQHMLDL